MITYGKQSIDQEDIDAVVNILRSDWLTQGPAVYNFENDLKDYFGSKHSCALSNGTAALHLTGLALGWKPGDIVITTPITFLASANCIIYAGATPEFVDIDPKSYTIDPNKLEERVKFYRSKNRNVKAVIGVDFAGHPCDWKALRDIADRFCLQLVNDNCHAMGAVYTGDKQYAVKYADIVVQSFHPVKHITTGEGGAILTNDPFINEKVKRLRTHGMTKDQDQLECNDGPWYYEMHDVGYNYRITDLQCALGSSQLKKLDLFIDKRREIADKYDAVFSEVGIFTIPSSHSSVSHAYHLYPLKIDFERLSFSKSDLFGSMKAVGINLQVHYIPIHLQPFYRKYYGYTSGNYPVAEKFYLQEVSMPIYPTLNDDEQKLTINSVIKIINREMI